MRKALAIALVALVLGGCNKSTEPIEESYKKIEFASQVSRALIENMSDLQQQQLKLYASYTLDGRTAPLFDAVPLYYDATLPGWDYAATQYWIRGASYSFFAISPFITPCTYSESQGALTLTNYESSTSGADVIYATAMRNLAEAEDFSTVFLSFRHACAAVKFNLVNASNATVTDVRNIRLVGLHNKGNFRIEADGSASWTLDSSTISPTGATQPFGGACTLPEGGLPVNLNVKHSLYDNGAIVVPPQSIYKTGVTFHLEYIKKGETEYAVRDIELGLLGGSTPTEWKAGEKYEYNLTITDNTITTEVRVVDWVDHYVDL